MSRNVRSDDPMTRRPRSLADLVEAFAAGAPVGDVSGWPRTVLALTIAADVGVSITASASTPFGASRGVTTLTGSLSPLTPGPDDYVLGPMRPLPARVSDKDAAGEVGGLVMVLLVDRAEGSLPLPSDSAVSPDAVHPVRLDSTIEAFNEGRVVAGWPTTLVALRAAADVGVTFRSYVAINHDDSDAEVVVVQGTLDSIRPGQHAVDLPLIPHDDVDDARTFGRLLDAMKHLLVARAEERLAAA